MPSQSQSNKSLRLTLQPGWHAIWYAFQWLNYPMSFHVALRRHERMKIAPGYASLPACSIYHLRHRSMFEMINTARWKRCVPRDFPQEPSMNTLWQDLRFGARMMIKAPGFTLIAVLSVEIRIASVSVVISRVLGMLVIDLAVRQRDS